MDLDANAIEYAKNLLGSFSDLVQFTRANIFKFNATEQYDFIWSAGLFDYFNDADFVKVLAKIFSWCAVNGEVVIGNFSLENPTRSYMEKAYDWYLYHRSAAQLSDLASNAGIIPEHVEVRTEPLGVNLFMHMKRACATDCAQRRA